MERNNCQLHSHANLSSKKEFWRWNLAVAVEFEKTLFYCFVRRQHPEVCLELLFVFPHLPVRQCRRAAHRSRGGRRREALLIRLAYRCPRHTLNRGNGGSSRYLHLQSQGLLLETRKALAQIINVYKTSFSYLVSLEDPFLLPCYLECGSSSPLLCA